jgi:hypothetical protein
MGDYVSKRGREVKFLVTVLSIGPQIMSDTRAVGDVSIPAASDDDDIFSLVEKQTKSIIRRHIIETTDVSSAFFTARVVVCPFPTSKLNIQRENVRSCVGRFNPVTEPIWDG